MPTEIRFVAPDQLPADAELLVVLGRKARLTSDAVVSRLPAEASAVWAAMVDGLKPRDRGDATTTWLPGGGRLCAAAISEGHSRHNSPGRPDVVTEILESWGNRGHRIAVLLVLDDASHAFALGCAAARAFPLYSLKNPAEDNGDAGDRQVSLAFVGPDGPVTPTERITTAAEGVRLAARLVDMPTAELTTDDFVAEAEQVASDTGAQIKIIRGEELRDGGFGGLWGVGKAAVHLPALVILSHQPKGATRTTCWVGKGIVYDTGGLSIKSSANMPGMKRDMGGAAAVLGAFRTVAKLGLKENVHALLCLAENSVGPLAVRPDDILTMYSGKTVEINNTDAEGRLVLADGISYAGKHLSPDRIIDIATLTGAQMIATGRRHAAIVTDDEALEDEAITAGLRSGDLVHPLPYCPEMFRGELDSKVADLKNSVEDRMNAQSSCAAQFVNEHRGSYEGPWLHVDMAGPVHIGERASGYGVALLVEMTQSA